MMIEFAKVMFELTSDPEYLQDFKCYSKQLDGHMWSEVSGYYKDFMGM
jgi:hypothetical protein